MEKKIISILKNVHFLVKVVNRKRYEVHQFLMAAEFKVQSMSAWYVTVEKITTSMTSKLGKIARLGNGNETDTNQGIEARRLYNNIHVLELTDNV